MAALAATKRENAAHVTSATFKCPYQAHAPFGPNCALAKAVNGYDSPI
jgi:hypothetical protein